MSEWTEEDSSGFRRIAEIAVPRRSEMMATIVSAVPFAQDEAFRIVEIGSGQGLLAATLLGCFPHATLLAFDGSESMRKRTVELAAEFGGRIAVRAFELETLDWWDLMRGCDVVVSSLCLHHLPDAKKQYLYKAIADRLSDRGALLVADLIDPPATPARRLAADVWDAAAKARADAIGAPDLYERFVAARWNHYRFADAMDRPAALLHHLVWLKHSGFPAVDCLWLYAGHAVYGAFKRAGADALGEGVSFDRAIAAVEQVLMSAEARPSASAPPLPAGS
jgi:tRNA (cmo5U34)-methyltransferase